MKRAASILRRVAHIWLARKLVPEKSPEYFLGVQLAYRVNPVPTLHTPCSASTTSRSARLHHNRILRRRLSPPACLIRCQKSARGGPRTN
ncbi:hypothetical protein P8C59_002899 [Phyllachora maydis]|uniref:Uncharacterized protein n=1 Tax=Phyllachora maydis TaxID=1825666 RepID=A0AAD9HZJ8_9PEZI|nr:hypothetical protein P8C59_002899 [Phyllachora maydis]